MRDEGYSDMQKLPVYDPKGVELGVIEDFVFSDNFELTHFVLQTRSGTKLAFKESNIMKLEENKVHLSVGSDSMPFNFETEHGYQFRDILDTRILDADSQVIGNVMDVVFHTDNKLSFVVGGKGLKKKLGLQHNLLIPSRYITHFSTDSIKISAHQIELESQISLERAYRSNEAQRVASSNVDIGTYRTRVA